MTDPTPSQRLAEAVEILRLHNVWRRGEDDSVPATDPGKLGAAIDTVCEMVPEMIAQREDDAAEIAGAAVHFRTRGATGKAKMLDAIARRLRGDRAGGDETCQRK